VIAFFQVNQAGTDRLDCDTLSQCDCPVPVCVLRVNLKDVASFALKQSETGTVRISRGYNAARSGVFGT
jgi:hypothetical protein